MKLVDGKAKPCHDGCVKELHGLQLLSLLSPR
jgi:hypothetical protein